MGRLVRKPDSNKGTYGRTLIIAGSKNMGGAAILNASAVQKWNRACKGTYMRLIRRTVMQNARMSDINISG
ncbi:MAG: hypothetical protein ACLRMX_10105 [Lachnospira eligens]